MKILLFISLSLIFFGNLVNEANYKRLNNQSIKNAALKTAQININEVLWLRKKYKIERRYPHCLMTDKERLAIEAQESEIFLKYGNLFWQRINGEVDSIEKRGLGYKKAQFFDLKKYLERNNYTIYNPSNSSRIHLFVFTNFKINGNGKLSDIELNTKGSESKFGKEKCQKFKNKLNHLLEKAPFIKPSTFLNEGIDDHAQIFIVPLGRVVR